MPSCVDFSELLLDHLYGLLEPDEADALRAHLAACPQCAAELVEAQKQQALLGQAAQMYRDLAPFVAPVEKFAVVPAEEASPAPVSTQARRFWQRRLPWVAAAAAVLIAVVGGMWWYQERVGELRQEANRARKQVEAVDSQIALVHREFKQKGDQLPAQLQDRFTHLHVIGPAVVQPDAPAPFRVTTRDVAGRPRPAEVVVRWRGDETREFRFDSAGEQAVELPAGLTSRAGRATIEVESRVAGEVAKLSEAVEVREPAYVTHLALNKSSYRIGEVLFFRTLTLERYSLKPPAEKIALRYALLDAQGQAKRDVPGFTGAGGIGGGEFALTEDFPDGEYTLLVREEGTSGRVLPQRRRIDIQRGLNPEIRFDRAQYRPGDDVTATYQSRRLANGAPMANLPITSTVKVDGKFVPAPGAPPAGGPMQTQTDERGMASLRFRLPDRIDKGNAQVEVQQHDGTKNEKLVRNIPVVASRLTVDFFPEGGDLVAGVPTRVYYRVRTPLGEPAAPEGHVILMSSKEVIFDSPRNQGIGVFTFTPQLNETYTLRVTWPKRGSETENWVETTNPFTDLVQARGITLAVAEPVGPQDAPLAVSLRNTGSAQRLALIATCRGRVVDERLVDVPAGVAEKDGTLRAGSAETTLKPVSGAAGVLRVTVYEPRDGQLIPLAERLVYRLPAQALTLDVTSAKLEYGPSERAQLRVRAKDETGKDASGWALGIVVDERVAPLDQPGLPSHFLLLSDVRQDVENADLLVTDAASVAYAAEVFAGNGALLRAVETAERMQSRHALDLYLGTSGWRRFVNRREDALLALGGEAGGRGGDAKKAAESAALLSSENVGAARLAQQYQTALAQATRDLRTPMHEKLQLLAGDRAQRLQHAGAAALALANLEENTRQALRLGLGILLIALVAIGGLLVIYSLMRMARNHASPRMALAAALGMLFSAVILYAASGRILSPAADTETTDALAQLTTKGVPALPDRPAAGVVPVWREVEGLFFGRGARAEGGEGPLPAAAGALRGADARKADADGAASLPKSFAFADPGRTAARDSNLNRVAPSSERFLQAKQKEAEIHEAMKKTTSGGAAQAAQAKGGKAKALQEAASTARQYAYGLNRGPEVPDLVSWEPALILTPHGAVVSFDLPDVPTTYRVLFYGNSPSGRLGYFQGTLRVR